MQLKAFFTSYHLKKILLVCVFYQRTACEHQGNKHAELSGQSRHLLLLEMWLWEREREKKKGLEKWVLRGRGWMDGMLVVVDRHTFSRGLSQSSHFNLCPGGWRNQCTLILQSSTCLRREKHCLSEIRLLFLITTRYSKHTHKHVYTHTLSHWNALIVIPEVGEVLAAPHRYTVQILDISLSSKRRYPEAISFGEILFVCSVCITIQWHFPWHFLSRNMIVSGANRVVHFHSFHWSKSINVTFAKPYHWFVCFIYYSHLTSETDKQAGIQQLSQNSVL